MYLPPSYEQNSYVRLHKRHPWQHIAKTVEVRELPVREQDWPYVSCGLGIGNPRPRRDRRRLRLPLASVTPSNIIDFLSMSSCPSQGPMSWYLIPSRSPSLTSTRFHDWDRFSGFPKIQGHQDEISCTLPMSLTFNISPVFTRSLHLLMLSWRAIHPILWFFTKTLTVKRSSYFHEILQPTRDAVEYIARSLNAVSFCG